MKVNGLISVKRPLLCFLARHSYTAYGMMNTRVAVRLQREAVIIPVQNRIGIGNLTFKPEEARFVGLLHRVFAQREGLVVDVGANVGRFLIYVIAADRTRPYVGFEPSSAAAAYVQSLINANGLTSHCVVAAALGSSTGVVRLSANSETDVSATTVAGFYGSRRFRGSTIVPSFEGDAVLPSVAGLPVALIKVDVEGGELEVLLGLRQTVARWRPSLIVEIIPPRVNVTDEATATLRSTRIARLANLLREWEYRAFRIVDGDRLEPREGCVVPADSVDIINMDYLCVPREHAAAIAS
jgi:FkbM family methyltransferase